MGEAGVEVGRSSDARLRNWELLLRVIGSHVWVCEQARDLNTRRLDLWESREHLAEGLVQATLIVSSGCIEEGRGRQIFEEQSDQDVVRHQRWGAKERYR